MLVLQSCDSLSAAGLELLMSEAVQGQRLVVRLIVHSWSRLEGTHGVLSAEQAIGVQQVVVARRGSEATPGLACQLR